MISVPDSSVVVAALVDSRAPGAWALERLSEAPLVAPALLPAEVTNVLRRLVLARVVSADVAALARADLQDLDIELLDFDPVAERVWELRHAVTAYDAWYVAVAESFDAHLLTLDRRLLSAPGPRCRFVTIGDG